MPRMKKNSTKKQRLRKTGTVKKKSSNKSNRSSDIVTNNFEIFVTDFLTDPCGLPVELRDCVLVDGATSINITADDFSSNNYEVLKNLLKTNQSIMKSSIPLTAEDSSKNTKDSEHKMNI